LALRIARSYTTAKNKNDVIVLDVAYHGHTQSLGNNHNNNHTNNTNNNNRTS